MALSNVFFVRNALEIRDSDWNVIDENTIALPSGKEAFVYFREDGAEVMGCHGYSREERFAICSYVADTWKKEGIRERSVQSLEAEMALHSICYRLGIEKEKAKDAYLDKKEDERWYVSASVNIVEAMGL